jgi:hypothetical protein
MKSELHVKDKNRINLRLSPEIFAAIDDDRACRPGSISRNTWITEAIQEKLLREGGRLKTQGGNADA